MKRYNLLAGIALATIGLVILVSLLSGPTKFTAMDNLMPLILKARNFSFAPNIKTIHATAGKQDARLCKSCHSQMTTSKYYPFHNKHLSIPFARFQCPHCHKKVELTPRDMDGKYRINRKLCYLCHGRKFPGDLPNSLMKPDFRKRNCLMCHTTGQWRYRHKRPMLKQVIDAKYCIICHGGRYFGFPKQHREITWIKIHGTVAKEVGVHKVCVNCHTKRELDLCSTCHKNPFKLRKVGP